MKETQKPERGLGSLRGCLAAPSQHFHRLLPHERPRRLHWHRPRRCPRRLDLGWHRIPRLSSVNQELWHAFDRIKDGLDKQERMRSTPTFREWYVKALPQFSKYLDVVDKADDESPGGLLCEWMDWLDARGLAFRGQRRWRIPEKGPLSFYPPTMEQVMKTAAELTRSLGLEPALIRSAALREALTTKTPGANGEGRAKKSRKKK